MDWIAPAAVFLCTAALAGLGMGGAVRVLTRRAILDYPTQRSSHSTPTPKGAGLALVPVILVAWALIGWNPGAWHGGGADQGLGWLIAGAVFLAAVSWVDDLRSLAPWFRLAAQAAAVFLVLAPGPGPFFGTLLPPVLDLFVAAFLWLWFVNLFNFMDGIDGLAGVETGTIGLGVAGTVLLAGLDPSLAFEGLVLAAAGGVFLFWNWQPARIFLGDVGSVPLGFLLGWLLLELARGGQWAAALIVALYYLADATLTLLRRAFRLDAVWRPHREHFYQLAVRAGASHAQVTGRIALADLCLLGLALVAATGRPGLALAAALAVVAVLLFHLARGAPGGGAGTP